MTKTWIVSDLDGTLLNSNHDISDNTLAAIREFVGKGGCFTIATGRILASASHYIKKLELCQPIILYNGAMIYNPVTETVIEQSFLPASSLVFSLRAYERFLDEHGLAFVVYSGERLYGDRMTKRLETLLKKENLDIALKPSSDLAELRSIKAMIVGDAAEIGAFYRYGIRQLNPKMSMIWNAVNSEPEMLEIIPPLVNKGSAFKRLAYLYGGGDCRFAAVGDNLNDMEMIAVADCGIAVQNANPKLKEVADWVTENTNDEDVMLEIIEKLG